jgi:glycosyltransferase 2 family protein
MSSRPCAACTRTTRDDALILKSAPARIALQVALSVGLIAVLLWQADLHRIGNALRDTSPGWFGAAIAINIVATGIMALRWYLLLRARGRREPGLWWLFETYSIALLLGQILPTAVGGDAVRAIDLARRTGARAEAVSSVLVDRVVGLAALGALAAGGALAGGTGIGRGTAIALGLGVVAATALAALALFSLRLRPALRRLAPLTRRLRVEGPLRALYHALHAYRGHPGALGLVFVLGVVAQGMRAISIWFLAQGMDLGLGFASLLVLCPVLFLVTIVPVSLNGIGLREATFVVVLRGADVGREDAFALGLAFFAVGVLTGGLGGLALLRRAVAAQRGRTAESRPVT